MSQPRAIPPQTSPYVESRQTFYDAISQRTNTKSASMHGETAINLIYSISSSSRVLDLATWSGAVALAAAERITHEDGGFVLGIDISPGLLDLARQEASRCHMQEYVTFAMQDVTAMTFSSTYPARSFDIVTCAKAIAMLSDCPSVLRSIATDILRPGGLFAVDISGTHIPTKLFLAAAIPRGFRAPVDKAWISRPGDYLFETIKYPFLQVRSVNSIQAAHKSRWDVGTSEKIEALWQNVTIDSPWLSFGIQSSA